GTHPQRDTGDPGGYARRSLLRKAGDGLVYGWQSLGCFWFAYPRADSRSSHFAFGNSLRNRCRDDRPVRFDHRYGSRTGDPKIPGSDAYAIQDCKRESDSACYAGRSGPNYGQRDFHPEDCEERRRTVMQQHSLFSGQPPQQPQATSKSETGLNVLTVSQLTADIKMLLEAGLPHLWVEGEITNFTQSGNGHFYFSLKDERAIIR